MSGIRTSLVEDAHSYTRSSMPWRLEVEVDRAAQARTAKGKVFGWKLFHYISGGGMKTFGRSVRQEEADARRNRFLAAAGVVGALWLWFWLG